MSPNTGRKNWRKDQDRFPPPFSSPNPARLPPPLTPPSSISTSPSSISTPPSSTSTSTSDIYPPLTTLFTPHPSCASFYISYCAGLSCYAKAFPEATCLDESEQLTVRSSLSCYPETTRGNNVLTYSPGYLCPVGMTTVNSVSMLDGAWCCPTGLTFTNGLCEKTTSQATLLSTNFNNCANAEIMTITRIINGEDGIVLSATPILLTGQKLPNATAFTSAPPKPRQKGVPTGQSPLSITTKTGIIVGSIFGAAILSLFAAFHIWRRIRAKAATKVQSEQVAKAEHDEYTGKPELEGSEVNVYIVKAELDAAAIRAELEGDLREPGGDGIHVLKPELEGTVGTEENRGAYVRKKSELEATLEPCASTGRHDIAELEAGVSSARVGVSIAARSDI
ncbi:hypothetical protein F5Y10DRAFT_261438 [Nemania abortiva]|nr:hypothetical protein F5Y10DRAFT_261438 [Nemania abortiva]